MDERGMASADAVDSDGLETPQPSVEGAVTLVRDEPFPRELFPLFRNSTIVYKVYYSKHRNIALYEDRLIAAITPPRYRVPIAAAEPDGAEVFLQSVSYCKDIIDLRMDEIEHCEADLSDERTFSGSYPTVIFRIQPYGDSQRKFHVELAESPHMLQALGEMLGERFEVTEHLAERFQTRQMKYLARREEGREHTRTHAGSEPTYSRAGGFLTVLLGVGLLGLCFWLVWSTIFNLGDFWWRLPLAFFTFVAARTAVEFGHGMAAPRYRHVMAKATEPPILYLRSFNSEGTDIPPRAAVLMVQSVWEVMDRYFVGYALRLVFALVRLIRMITATGSQRVEERIAPILRRFGPMVAIGKPGEASTSLGAARAYVGDDEWQDFIRQTMAQAQLVAIQVESTDGTWWELEQTLREMPIERVLMLFTMRYGSRQNYEEVWLKVHRGLGFQLPRYIGSAAFIYFDPDGTPNMLPLQYHSPLVAWLTPSPIAWRRSLRPFLQHFEQYAGLARGKVS